MTTQAPTAKRADQLCASGRVPPIATPVSSAPGIRLPVDPVQPARPPHPRDRRAPGRRAARTLPPPLEHDGRRRLISLSRPITHIGRGLIADIRLEDPHVSRRHAIIAIRGDGPDAVRVLDDRSSGGMFVNRRRRDRRRAARRRHRPGRAPRFRYTEIPPALKRDRARAGSPWAFDAPAGAARSQRSNRGPGRRLRPRPSPPLRAIGPGAGAAGRRPVARPGRPGER